MVHTENYFCRKTRLHPDTKMPESFEMNEWEYGIHERESVKNQAAKPGRQRSSKEKEYAIEKVRCSKILLSNLLSSSFIADVWLLMCFNEWLSSYSPDSSSTSQLQSITPAEGGNSIDLSLSRFSDACRFFQPKYFSL